MARRALQKLGADIATARKKRSLTVSMMADRMGVAATTYLRIEKGDPSVSIGGYAAALSALGMPGLFGDLIDPRKDSRGLLFDAEQLPKSVRVRKQAKPL